MDNMPDVSRLATTHATHLTSRAQCQRDLSPSPDKPVMLQEARDAFRAIYRLIRVMQTLGPFAEGTGSEYWRHPRT